MVDAIIYPARKLSKNVDICLDTFAQFLLTFFLTWPLSPGPFLQSADHSSGKEKFLGAEWCVVGKCCCGALLETGARSCRHRGPDLTIRIGVKDRISKLLLAQYVLGFWGLFKP